MISNDASTLGLKANSILMILIEVNPADAEFHFWTRTLEYYIQNLNNCSPDIDETNSALVSYIDKYQTENLIPTAIVIGNAAITVDLGALNHRDAIKSYIPDADCEESISPEFSYMQVTSVIGNDGTSFDTDATPFGFTRDMHPVLDDINDYPSTVRIVKLSKATNQLIFEAGPTEEFVG